MNFKLVVSCLMPDTYSNYLVIFDVIIFLSGPTSPYLLSQPKNLISARTLARNTYKVTMLTKIPETELIVAILEDRGA